MRPCVERSGRRWNYVLVPGPRLCGLPSMSASSAALVEISVTVALLPACPLSASPGCTAANRFIVETPEMILLLILGVATLGYTVPVAVPRLSTQLELNVSAVRAENLTAWSVGATSLFNLPLKPSDYVAGTRFLKSTPYWRSGDLSDKHHVLARSAQCVLPRR